MPNDPKGEPWSDATYRGFSDARAPKAPGETPTPAGRPSSRALMFGGVAAALALGVALGLFMRPQLIGSKPTATAAPPSSAAPTEPATPGAAQVPLVVSEPPPSAAPIPRAPGKLQTLPPEMEAAARAQTPPQAVTIHPPPPVEADTADAAPPTPEAGETAPAPRYHASFDCETARPGAEEMVCSDAELAAADRRMARAYRRAMASGVDPADLRQEQRDWVAIREDAAQHSQRALAEVYDQRIRELNEIADTAPQPAE